jgi:hypothetical protein
VASSDWISASAGGFHNLGVRANGSLWAWGNNGQGRSWRRYITKSKFSSFSRRWFTVTGSQQVQALLTVSVSVLMEPSGHGDTTAAVDLATTRSRVVLLQSQSWVALPTGSQLVQVVLTVLASEPTVALWAWGSNLIRSTRRRHGHESQFTSVSVVGGFTDWISASAGGRSQSRCKEWIMTVTINKATHRSLRFKRSSPA